MPHLSRLAFIVVILFCLLGWLSGPLALALGVVISNVVGNVHAQLTGQLTKVVLQVSVVGLGFGMNLFEAAQIGQTGFLLTLFSIVITIGLGILGGKLLAVNSTVSFLITSGTAICGGSAIAAISPILNAKPNEASIALGIVFILNAIALFLFPFIGSTLHLSQEQFGLWAALAIHDTSAVVGAAYKYGEEALVVATTVKLERALWIIPLSLITSLILHRKEAKFKVPYFIFSFLLAIVINTFLPFPQYTTLLITTTAKRLLVVALFLIGTTLTPAKLKLTDARALILGTALWIIISTVSVLIILTTER